MTLTIYYMLWELNMVIISTAVIASKIEHINAYNISEYDAVQ